VLDRAARGGAGAGDGLDRAATVQGWDDDDGSQIGLLDGLILNELPQDDLLDGVSLQIARPGRFTVQSRDMTVTFDVRREGRCRTR
jgi:hypothetical protein